MWKEKFNRTILLGMALRGQGPYMKIIFNTMSPADIEEYKTNAYQVKKIQYRSNTESE